MCYCWMLFLALQDVLLLDIDFGIAGCVTIGCYFCHCRMCYCWMLVLALQDVLLLDVIFVIAGCVTVGCWF